MDFTIEKMQDEDWPAVQSAYREGIADGNATFETQVPEGDKWDVENVLAKWMAFGGMSFLWNDEAKLWEFRKRENQNERKTGFKFD